MKDDAPSRTAAFVAAARHLGMLLPDNVRLVDDPYGAAFASPAMARLIARSRDRLMPVAALPGLRPWILYMQVRTRVIDDALAAWVAGGGRQVVLLGAGYDGRALRMPALADVRVIEVDHPATQNHKRGVLAGMGVTSPAEYVTWDFESRAMDDLADILDLHGPVFTIWEGVTMYLTEPAIDASLRAIRAWSAAGSQLALTYFAKSFVNEPSLMSRAIAAVVATFGEPFKFGWQPDDIVGYFASRQLQIVRDVAFSDAAKELLPRDLAAYLANPDRRFALAAISS